MQSILPPNGDKYRQIDALESLFLVGKEAPEGKYAKLNKNTWISMEKINGYMDVYHVDRSAHTGIPRNLFAHVRQHRKRVCVPISADEVRNHKLPGLLFLVEEDAKTTKVRYNEEA